MGNTNRWSRGQKDNTTACLKTLRGMACILNTLFAPQKAFLELTLKFMLFLQETHNVIFLMKKWIWSFRVSDKNIALASKISI